MKLVYIILIFTIHGCNNSDKGIIKSDCERIQNYELCVAEGCTPIIGAKFNILSGDRNRCITKQIGSICLPVQLPCDYNTTMTWGEKVLPNGNLLLMYDVPWFDCIEGWQNSRYFDLAFEPDPCGFEVPDSTELEYSGSESNWYPFSE